MSAAQRPSERPAAFQGDLRNLPEALAPLKALNNWVVWRWTPGANKRGDVKWTKPPYQPGNPGRHARNNDPTTWGSYDAAVAVFQAGQCDGIGFNLFGTDIAAFDIDKCRDKETGEIAPEAMDLVDRAASYTEMTVSGTGLRIIGFGSGDKVHTKQAWPGSTVEVESYRGAERYIVVTGNRLPGAWPHLADITAEMDDLVAELGGKPDDGNVLKFEQRESSQTHDAFLPRELVDLIERGPAPHEDHSRAFHHAVCWLFDRGWSPGRIETYIAGKPIVPERYNHRLAGEIARCIGRAKPKSDWTRGESHSEGPKAEGGPVSDAVEPVDLWGSFDPPPLPSGLLPDLIEAYAVEQGATMGVDPGGVAMAALAVCAAAIPDRIQLVMKRHSTGWRESARIWVTLDGMPSTKKSPIIAAAVWPLARLDAELVRQYQFEMRQWEQLDKDQRKTEPKPVQKRHRLEDTTIEAAQEALGGSPDGLLVVQDELSGFFGSMDKYGGNRGGAKDRGFWLQAYNGGQYSVSRIVRGVGIIPNLSVCMLGGIQPDVIRQLAGESQDDGFLQRMLVVVLRPAAIGTDEPRSSVVGNYADLVERLTKLGLPVSGNLATDDGLLRLDSRAHEIRRKLEVEHHAIECIELINPKLSAHVGKYGGLFGRLCVTFHCIEHAYDNYIPEFVTGETAERVANFIRRFLLPHALAFYAGTLGLSNDHDRLANVAGFILAHRKEQLTNRDVQASCRTMRKLEQRDTRVVFEQLEALGWLTQIAGPRPSSPPQWIVNPRVHEKFAERARTEIERRKKVQAIITDLAATGVAS